MLFGCSDCNCRCPCACPSCGSDCLEVTFDGVSTVDEDCDIRSIINGKPIYLTHATYGAGGTQGLPSGEPQGEYREWHGVDVAWPGVVNLMSQTGSGATLRYYFNGLEDGDPTWTLNRVEIVSAGIGYVSGDPPEEKQNPKSECYVHPCASKYCEFVWPTVSLQFSTLTAPSGLYVAGVNEGQSGEDRDSSATYSVTTERIGGTPYWQITGAVISQPVAGAIVDGVVRNVSMSGRRGLPGTKTVGSLRINTRRTPPAYSFFARPEAAGTGFVGDATFSESLRDGKKVWSLDSVQVADGGGGYSVGQEILCAVPGGSLWERYITRPSLSVAAVSESGAVLSVSISEPGIFYFDTGEAETADVVQGGEYVGDGGAVISASIDSPGTLTMPSCWYASGTFCGYNSNQNAANPASMGAGPLEPLSGGSAKTAAGLWRSWNEIVFSLAATSGSSVDVYVRHPLSEDDPACDGLEIPLSAGVNLHGDLAHAFNGATMRIAHVSKAAATACEENEQTDLCEMPDSIAVTWNFDAPVPEEHQGIDGVPFILDRKTATDGIDNDCNGWLSYGAYNASAEGFPGINPTLWLVNVRPVNRTGVNARVLSTRGGGCVARAVVPQDGGPISSIEILLPGSGYHPANVTTRLEPTLTAAPHESATGSGCVLGSPVLNFIPYPPPGNYRPTWEIASVPVESPGSGYSEGDTVRFSYGDGTEERRAVGTLVLRRLEPDISIAGHTSDDDAPFTVTLDQMAGGTDSNYWTISSVSIGALAGSPGYIHNSRLDIESGGGLIVQSAADLRIRTARVKPTVSAVAAGGAGAVLTANMTLASNGPNATWEVSSVTVEDGGTGYSNGAAVTFAATNGVQVGPTTAASAVIATVVTDPTPIEPWTHAIGYSPSRDEYVLGGAALTATHRVAFMFNNSPYYEVDTVTLVSGGAGYEVGDLLGFLETEPPIVAEYYGVSNPYFDASIEVEQFFFATITEVDENGGVVAFNIDSRGLYRRPAVDTGVIESVQITEGGRYYANGDAIESVQVNSGGAYYKFDGSVKRVSLTDGGRYYRGVEVPDGFGFSAWVVIDAFGGGSGATAVVTADQDAGSPTYGQITAITLTNGGNGYRTRRCKGWQVLYGGGYDCEGVTGARGTIVDSRCPADAIFQTFCAIRLGNNGGTTGTVTISEA